MPIVPYTAESHNEILFIFEKPSRCYHKGFRYSSKILVTFYYIFVIVGTKQPQPAKLQPAIF